MKVQSCLVYDNLIWLINKVLYKIPLIQLQDTLKIYFATHILNIKYIASQNISNNKKSACGILKLPCITQYQYFVFPPRANTCQFSQMFNHLSIWGLVNSSIHSTSATTCIYALLHTTTAYVTHTYIEFFICCLNGCYKLLGQHS